MIDFFLSLLLIPIVCLLIWCYTQKIRFKTLENIPGPKPYPIIGNMLYFHTNVKAEAAKKLTVLSSGNKISKMHEASYELKKSAICWNKRVEQESRKFGASSTEADASIYVTGQGAEDLIIIVYVDGIIMLSRVTARIDSLQHLLKKSFEIEEMDIISNCLEIVFQRNIKTTTIKQRGYILDILNRFEMTTCNAVLTPLDPSINLSKSDVWRIEDKTRPLHRGLVNVQKRKTVIFFNLNTEFNVPMLHVQPHGRDELHVFLNHVYSDAFNDFIKLSKVYKPTAKFWTGPNQLNLLTTDPDLMKLILKSTKQIEKTDEYGYLRSFLGDGLITSKGSLWLKRRKMLNSTFCPEILRNNNKIFNDRSDVLIKNISKELHGGDIEIFPFLSYMTMEAIIESSSCISAADERFKEYSDIYKHIHHGSEIVISRAFSYWKWLEILFRFHPDYRRSKIFVNYTSRLTRMLMNERRQILQDNCRVKQLAEVDALEKKNGYLDTMLCGKIDEKPLADTEIMEELITVLAAGIETTALWISFALYELSRNPDIQDRVVKEIRGIFGDNKNHRPSFQDYSKMTYTELVLKEVLRLYPTVPYVGRKLQEDVDHNGTVIPKDTNIYLFFYGMHRREDLFPDADKFDPGRFETGKASSHPFSFLPFSAGPRMCLGYKYAMYQGKCVLSRLLMNFEALPSAIKYEIKLHATISLVASPEILIQLKERRLN